MQTGDAPPCLRLAVVSVEATGRSFVIWSAAVQLGQSVPVVINVCGVTHFQLVSRRVRKFVLAAVLGTQKGGCC